MNIIIAATFTDALARLPAAEQKAAKTSAFDLQTNPQHPGLQMHRIDKSRDTNFWSARVNADLRIIVHKTSASLMLAYVDHHDKAYAWAERRRIEAHPTTGAIQIVEVRERVEDLPLFTPKPAAGPFARLADDDLLSVGVPADWLADVRAASEDSFLDLAPHLPAEAAEALLQLATTGVFRKPAPAPKPADPFAHSDALRRFRVVENLAELAQALDAPWEKWLVYLHPSQRDFVERAFNGPARVAGSAGTGKTVVALHRAARLARSSPQARVLLATFSEPLAASLAAKARLLIGPEPGVAPRLRVASLQGIADELYELSFGRRALIAKPDQIARALERGVESAGVADANLNFVASEWAHVVDAWQVKDVETYLAVPRLGRARRVGSKKREKLWPVFAAARASLEARGFQTWPGVFAALTAHFAARAEKPFTHVVVDEAQDLGVPELRFLAAVSAGVAGLFFAGDLGQRIFQQPFSWKSLGVDIVGRSATLKVNYRTSHQIRRAADRLIPVTIRDADNHVEDRNGTVSVFNGPEPQVLLAETETGESEAVAAFIRAALAEGVAAREIGVFVRDPERLARARAAVAAAGREALELSDRGEDPGERISIGTMHLAKGLEFKAVAVMACDEDALPQRARIEAVADEAELEDVYNTERQLLYVAATRARDRLLVSGVMPGSEFLRDLDRN